MDDALLDRPRLSELERHDVSPAGEGAQGAASGLDRRQVQAIAPLDDSALFSATATRAVARPPQEGQPAP